MKSRTLSALPLLLIFLLSSCFGGYKSYSSDFFGTFDTVVTVIGYEKSKGDYNELFEYAQKRFNELNRLYDIYNTYEGINNIKTVNDSAGLAPVKVAPELIDLLELSVDWFYKTGGKVNIAFGSVLNIWHNYREAALNAGGEGEIPTSQELKAADGHTDINSIVIDRESGTVFIKDKDTRIDLGAVAKGYATEVVANELMQMGFENFAISAGGNVKVAGAPVAKDKTKWVIGIQSPDEAIIPDPNEGILDKVLVKDTSIVTSGGYQRYFTSNGKIYNHIIDPDTLMPGDYYKAVTIVFPDSGVCDILSTAVFLMPYEEAVSFIETLGGVEALFVLNDGTVKTTPGMDKLLMSRGAER